MRGFNTSLEEAAIANTKFRKVLYTSPHSQLVLMSIDPGSEIGLETHMGNDQFVNVVRGYGTCVIDDHRYELKDGTAFVVPRGARHNVVNLSQTKALKLYTIYSPPHHKDGIERATKKEAEEHEEEYDGITTEGDMSVNGRMSLV